MVSFTGSTSVGQRIGEVCGRSMKRQLLELGGGMPPSSSTTPTSRPRRSAPSPRCGPSTPARSATAPTRVIAQRAVYDQVVGGLQQAAGRMKVGTRWSPTPSSALSSPTCSGAASKRCSGWASSRAPSCGRRRPPDHPTGFYVNPTLLAGASPTTPPCSRSSSGSVVVVPFDADEAIAIANGTEFGLRLRVLGRHVLGDARPRSCGRATSASTPPSGTTRRPSGASSSPAWVATAAASASSAYLELRRSCGPADQPALRCARK